MGIKYTEGPGRDPGDTVEEGVERLQEPEVQGVFWQMCLLGMSKATTIKAHQYNCPSMS